MPALRHSSLRTAFATATFAALFVVPSAAAPSTVGPRAVLKLPPLAPPYPIAQPISIDQSMMRSQLAEVAEAIAASEDINSYAGRNTLTVTDATRILHDQRVIKAFISKPYHTRIANAFYAGLDVQAGHGRPVETFPDLLFERPEDRVTLHYANVMDGLNGQDIGFRYALAPAPISTLYAVTNSLLLHALPPTTHGSIQNYEANLDTLGTVVQTYLTLLTSFGAKAVPGEHILVTPPMVPPITPVLNAINDLPVSTADPSDALYDYIRVSEETAVSVSGNYQTIDVRGYQSDVGINASKLLPLRGRGVPSAVTPLISIDDVRLVEDLFPSTQGVSLGGALIWQDRAPAIIQDMTTALTVPPLNLVPQWNFKVGLEYATPVLGAHETYAGFVRYREPRSYIEMTVTAGKDGARANYLEVDFGKTYFF